MYRGLTPHKITPMSGVLHTKRRVSWEFNGSIICRRSVIVDVELKHIASSVFWLRLGFFGSADRLSLLVGQTFFVWKVGIQLIPHRTFAGGNRVKARTIYPFGRQIKNKHNPVRGQPDRSQYVIRLNKRNLGNSMKLCTLLVMLTILFALPRLTTAQIADVQSKFAKNAVKAYERRQAKLRDAYEESLQKVELEFQEKFDASKSQLITELKESVADAAKKVDLDEANKLNTIAEQYESTLFSSLLLDKNRLGPKRGDELPEVLRGEWSGNWGTTGKQIRLELDKSGCKNNGRISFSNGRILILKKTKTQYLELIPHNGGILVLGYSSYKNLHPERTLPDHVGFVEKQE